MRVRLTVAAPVSRLARTLQLAGISTFSAAGNAVITSRVTRAGTYGVDCVVNDGFSYR